MGKAQTIVKLTAETNDYEKKMRQANKTFGDFMKGVGMSPAKLNALAIAIGATTTALKVAKDAFMQSETNVDNWGRTMASAKGVYESFLQTLNSGNFGNFFANLDNIISKAKAAYNALDELKTVMTIINPERARLQARQTELKATIRREGANSAAGKAAQTELRALEPQLSKSYQTESRMNYAAFEAEVERKLEGAGIKLAKSSFDYLMRSFSDESLYNRMKANARGSIGLRVDGAPGAFNEGSVERYDNRNINKKLLDLFTDSWRNEWSPYLTASFAAKGSAASVLLGDARYLNGGRGGAVGRGGGGGGSNTITYAPDSIAAQEKLVQDLTKAWREASAEMREGYLKQLKEAQTTLEDMKNPMAKLPKPSGDVLGGIGGNLVGSILTFGGLNEGAVTVPPEVLAKIAAAAMPAQKDNGFLHYTENGQAAYVKLDETLGGLASGMSEMVSGMEALGIDIPEGIKSAINAIQGVSSILTGISTTLLAIEAISSADAIIPFARGGVVKAAGGWSVPGNYNSMDQVPALLNSGELVLNRFQQQALAGALNNPMGNLNLTASLSGETINLAVKAGNIRRGRGEYVTTRTRKYGYNVDA